MNRPAVTIASGFGLGFSPVAPGTMGSLLGLFFAYLSFELPIGIRLLALAVITGIGWWSSEKAGQAWGHDHPRIVVDEIAGQYLTLLAAPAVSWFLTGFLLFRLADIVKPYPASALDRKKGGFFTMADDMMAGIYALVALWVAVRIANY
jgi:phosphatidylglycerophosphatase A